MSPGVSLAKTSEHGLAAIEHLGPTELTLIATSIKSWLINLLLKLRPPKPPDLSPEAMWKAGKIMIAIRSLAVWILIRMHSPKPDV